MRAYSYRNAVDLGLEPQRYNFANEEMTAEALLHFKVWGKKRNLQCYFQNIRTNELFILSAFCTSSERYTPRDRDIDFSEPGNEYGLYKVITAPNSKGKITWDSAALMLSPKHQSEIIARVVEVFKG